MRLGGPVHGKHESPEAWVKLVKAAGYRAAYCPVGVETDINLIKAYESAAKKADIVIAECGAWSNPISPDAKIREEAMSKCKKQLALADEIGALCCVNIAGSRGAKWDGPDKNDFTKSTFDLIVESVRQIIDAVKPKRAFYTLETMPWMYPDSPDSYLDLIKAIDRKAFAVHLDPVNIICSPQRYFSNTDILKECFKKLGPYIKSCHVKDIILRDKLTVHLDECRPGTGGIDYATYLKEAGKLNQDVPLMIEHLPNGEEYRLAAEHMRSVAKKEGLEI
ncbi:MAG TPA: xylose isomerase [Lentisphaeria bacterium]|nr:MAG: xylose isomerase [Lentisphaerae bacterium GWF2_49_21]HBC88359.1 xylose isomerase [Lentisphaeria bacterium]